MPAADEMPVRPLRVLLTGAALVGLLAVIAVHAGIVAGLFAAGFAALALVIARTDLQRFEIPHLANIALLLLGLAWQGASAGQQAILPAIAAGLSAALFMAAVKYAYRLLRGIDGLGWGDVKLAAACGVWLPWQLLPVTLLVAALGGLVAAGAAGIVAGKRPELTSAIPFGAFLAPAAWLVWTAALVRLI